MPTYEYVCEECGEELEAFQRMSEDPLKECPACGRSALKRKIGLGAGILFKGGGFYETDFKERKGKPDSGGEGEKAGKTAEKKKEGAAAGGSGGDGGSGGSAEKKAVPAAAGS